MKATIEVPDELYRRVKAKSAIEGQPVREVVMRLFQGWLGEEAEMPADREGLAGGRPAPAWFGAARKYARRVNRHDMTSVRRSIVRGRAREDSRRSPKGKDR